MRVAPHMILQNVKDTAWALAALRLRPPDTVVEALEAVTRRCCGQMQAHELSTTSWGLCTIAATREVPLKPATVAALNKAAKRVSINRLTSNEAADLLFAATALGQDQCAIVPRGVRCPF